MSFYKITKQQADTIGSFEYAPNCVFNPNITDGEYCYVNVKMYQLLKDTDPFKKINWWMVPIVQTVSIPAPNI